MTVLLTKNQCASDNLTALNYFEIYSKTEGPRV